MNVRRLAIVSGMALLGVVCFGLVSVQAAVTLVDRGLPTENINNVAGAIVATLLRGERRRRRFHRRRLRYRSAWRVLCD